MRCITFQLPTPFLRTTQAVARMNSSKSKPTEKKKPKKPFHIKKSDLRLDEYKQEIRDKSPGLLLRGALESLLTSRQFYLYLLLQALAAGFGYGQMMLCIGTASLPSFCYVLAATRNL